MPTFLLGVVVVTSGLIAGVAARNARNDACDVSTKLCEPDGLTRAHTLASVSTVLTVVGAITLVDGLGWFLASPSYAARDATKKARVPRLYPYLSPRGGGFVGTL